MQLNDFYTQYAKGNFFKMLALQQQIVVGESDTLIHIIYFMPTERGLASRFTDFIKKYSDFTQKPVCITTGGTEDNSDFGTFMDTDLFVHYHKKVTFWLVDKKGFDIVKSDTDFEKGYKVARNKFEAVNFISIIREKQYSQSRLDHAYDANFHSKQDNGHNVFDIPCSFAKFTLEYNPKKEK